MKRTPSTKSDGEERSLAKEKQDGDLRFQTAKFYITGGLGVVYLFAFLAAYNQNTALIGEQGLAPATLYMERLRQSGSGFMQHPTLFWFVELSDARMEAVAAVGMLISAALTLGAHSWVLLAVNWALYFSLVTLAGGSSFYAYGWESQLLETGFLVTLLCSSDDNMVAIWLLRWLCFRISIGAGLIKKRGGSCWADKTCLHYHFETQPVPSPLSFFFHFLPKSVLSAGVDLDLAVQLYTSWVVLVPGKSRPALLLRRGAGFLQVAFMVNIASSGNFSILNHLTPIPALACLDDSCWPKSMRKRRRPLARRWHIVDLLVLLLVGSLSVPVVMNLVRPNQVMNASFEPFRIVNTYGAFGSVGHARYEPIISVYINEWVELDLPCKPGDVTRRPCFSAPYHHRLDWNIWFIGFKPHLQMLQGREQWLYAFLAKLLQKDAKTAMLLDGRSRDLIMGTDEIIAAKVDMFHYEMAQPLWRIVGDRARSWRGTTTWWRRTYDSPLIPPVANHPDKINLILAEAAQLADRRLQWT